MKLSASLKQLWTESKANPGFTALYVGGVAFAVAFTMVFTIIYYVHLAPLYPEYNRGTTYYLNNVTARNDNTHGTTMGSISKEFIDKYIAQSENYEYYTAGTHNEHGFIQPQDKSGDFSVVTRYTDPNFFRLYSYEFIHGRPFNEAEFESAINNVVIDTYLAKRLFGSPEAAMGKEISLGFKPYRVIGVVRSGSPIAHTSYGNVFLPYTELSKYTSDNSNKRGDARDMCGGYWSTIKFKDEAQAKKFKAEINEKVRRANLADTTGWHLNIEGSLVSHTIKTLSQASRSGDMSSSEFFRPLMLTLVVLLIIPAINISGIIGGQMDRRLAEIGIRRSFGATRSELTRQVMIENFVMTLAGGIIGLIAAWIIIVFCRKWLLQVIIKSWDLIEAPEAASVSTELMFAPSIFIFTIIICLILNLLSAYIPVRMSLRHPIVSSLNSKR